MYRKKSQRGFSLLEMMVSMSLGLVVVLITIQIFISTRKNHSTNDTMTEVLENGRFALRIISSDLKAAGFLGGITDYSAIAQDTSLNLVTDCGPAAQANWVYDFSSDGYMQAIYSASNSEATASHQCIQGSEHLASTDVLSIKRTYGQIDTAALNENNVYLRSDYNTACLWYYSASNPIPNGADCPTAGYEDWRYLVHIYFIRPYAKTPGDNIPTLCRKMLTPTSGGTPIPDMQTLCIAQGVEHFHIEYGIDTDSPADGVANTYLANPTPAQIQDQVVSAKIYILARSKKEDSNFSNAKTYTMGSLVVVANDNYYRRIYNTTVNLRNPTNLLVFGGSL